MSQTLSDKLTLGQQLLADFTDMCVANAAVPCTGYATRRLLDLGITSSDELKQSVDALTIMGANTGSGSLVDEPGTLLLQKEQNDRDRTALEAFGWTDVWDCTTAVAGTADGARPLLASLPWRGRHSISSS